MTYRVLIAAALPILWMMLGSPGRAGTDAPDVGGQVGRRPARPLAPLAAVPDVRVAQVPTQQPAEVLSLRNPFAFAPSGVSPSPPPPVSIAPPPEPPVIAPSVALSLIGVATITRTDGRAERTAIITGPAGALYFVRDGDALISRYRVDAVLPDSVVLVEDATGASLRLSLL